MTKLCPKCKERPRGKWSKRMAPYCKPCARTILAQKRYKLTEKQVLDMRERECEICGKKSQAIDHCHKTGKVRGSLCKSCNTGIGIFKDSVGQLLKAITYLLDSQREK